MSLDKMIENGIRELRSPSTKRLVTFSIYECCKKYDPNGKCQRNIGSCYYGQLNNQKELICEHHKNKNIFSGNTPAYP